MTKYDKIWQNLKLESFKSLQISSLQLRLGAHFLQRMSGIIVQARRDVAPNVLGALAQWHPVTSSDQCLGNWWKLALNAWWWLLMLVECRWSWLTFVSLMPGFNLSPLQKSSLATLCDSARAWISWGTATCGACGRMAMLNVAIASDPTDPTADPRR